MNLDCNHTGLNVEENTLTKWGMEVINLAGSSAKISYSVAGKLGSSTTSFVKISIFDVSGREVKVLASGKENPGKHEVTWDGHSETGMSCPSGVYFIHMQTKEYMASKKVTLIR